MPEFIAHERLTSFEKAYGYVCPKDGSTLAAHKGERMVYDGQIGYGLYQKCKRVYAVMGLEKK